MLNGVQMALLQIDFRSISTCRYQLVRSTVLKTLLLDSVEAKSWIFSKITMSGFVVRLRGL